MKNRQARVRFAESVSRYVATSTSYDMWSKQQAVTEAVLVMTEDIGLAQDFLDVIGVDIDLYEQYQQSVQRPTPVIKYGEHRWGVFA